MKLGHVVDDAFEKYKLVRRLLVLWAVWLITIVVFRVMDTVTALDGPTVTLVGTIIGILATVTAFYIKSREIDDQFKREYMDFIQESKLDT